MAEDKEVRRSLLVQIDLRTAGMCRAASVPLNLNSIRTIAFYHVAAHCTRH